MVASWVRRDFSGIGVTQYRPGPNLEAIQQHFLGRALLCIDVSGSMHGERLATAIEGGLDFLAEAREAGYLAGLVLWHHGVEVYLPTDTSPERVTARLRRATSTGGNDLCPTLRRAIAELGSLPGDRVVCVFGDGDVGPVAPVSALAAEARSLGIRFVVRGLGAGATGELARTLTPEETDLRGRTVENVSSIRRGIASMAASLRTDRDG